MSQRRRALLFCILALGLAWGGSRATAQPAFVLVRLELIFANGRGDITVPHRYPDLRAYGLLRFTGTSVVHATWKVDGRILGAVVEPTLFGEDLIVASPSLPTFEPGLRRLTLEVTDPRPVFKLPEITYFVTNEDYETFRKRMERPQ